MGLPTGPGVTFMFTDIEGSTRLERAVGSAAWSEIVARHDGLLRSAIEAHGGVEAAHRLVEPRLRAVRGALLEQRVDALVALRRERRDRARL